MQIHNWRKLKLYYGTPTNYQFFAFEKFTPYPESNK
jgi:hypothetical protein